MSADYDNDLEELNANEKLSVFLSRTTENLFANK